MNILIAVDGSDASRHACRLVGGYAGDASKLRVTLLNVQRPPLRLSAHAGIEQPVLERALREEGARWLDEARALLPPGLGAVDAEVRIAQPAQALMDAAASTAASMLVMGGGRQGLLGGYAPGSVALRVAPAAPCPVVLVRADARLPATIGRAARVTAPVDGSPESVQAVQRLAACADVLGQLHVDLVHFQPGLTLAEAILPPHDDVMREWTGVEQEAAVASAVKILADAGIAHQVHQLVGAPDVEIAAFARERQADFVAMGTRGLGAMHHLLLGSVALRTAQRCDVPVAFMR